MVTTIEMVVSFLILLIEKTFEKEY